MIESIAIWVLANAVVVLAWSIICYTWRNDGQGK
jgi:hypothetical protein